MATKTKKSNQNHKNDNTVTKVIMVTPKGKKPTRTYDQNIKNFGTLGKEIRISPKANISVNAPGFATKFYVETVSVLIGIGKDHTADLIMTKDAWEALKKGAPIDITTTKEFKEKFL